MGSSVKTETTAQDQEDRLKAAAHILVKAAIRAIAENQQIGGAEQNPAGPE